MRRLLQKFGFATQPKSKPSPLMQAAAKGDDAKITLLLQSGENPLEQDAQGHTALDVLRAAMRRLQDDFQRLDDIAMGEPEIMLSRYRAAEKNLHAATVEAQASFAKELCTAGTRGALKVQKPLRIKMKVRP